MFTLSDLTVQQLESFVAVAEEGQFTRAAARLHVAQPSVSFQIRRMETVTGARLFHRGRGPVSLTDAGSVLLPLARRVLSDLAEIIDRVGELDGLQRGHVSIGATPSLGSALLPGVLSRFHRRHPGITLEVTERDSDQLADGLEIGMLDVALAIFPLRHPQLEHVTLAVEELVVVVPSDHELASAGEVSIRELVGVALIMFHEGYDLRSTTLEAFGAAGLTPTVSLDGAEIGSVLSLVEEGLGAAIVPSIVAAGAANVCVLRLVRPRLEREIGLVWHRDRPLSLAATALCDEIDAQLVEEGWPATPASGVRLVRH